MDAADERVLRALVNLEGSQDFMTVIGWLSESRNRIQTENSGILDETRLRWGQGQAQCLNEVLNTVDQARKLLAVLRK